MNAMLLLLVPIALQMDPVDLTQEPTLKGRVAKIVDGEARFQGQLVTRVSIEDNWEAPYFLNKLLVSYRNDSPESQQFDYLLSIYNGYGILIAVEHFQS